MTNEPNTAISDANPAARGGPFPRTRWSLVMQARGEGEVTLSGGRTISIANALEDLCKAYWSPLFAYARKSGFGKEDAEDVTQEFITWFVDRDHLAEADENKGKLRSYLLGHMRRFVADQRKFANAQKRGGGRRMVSIDAEEEEGNVATGPVEHETPDEIFERKWARSVMERAVGQLREEYAGRGKEPVFDALSPFLQWRPEDSDYRNAADRLGVSIPAVKMNVMRMRKRFAALFREEVLLTVGNEDELEAEIRHLMTLFGQ